MVEWLSVYLGGKLSPTALEYGCALLLNLCLDPSGRSAVARVAPIFLTTIANLISDHKLQVIEFSNYLFHYRLYLEIFYFLANILIHLKCSFCSN